MEEEHFLLLSGSLTVREFTEEEDSTRECELRAGELICYPPGSGLAHQFEKRGEGPARFLALSDRQPHDVIIYPDSGKTILRGLRQVGVLVGPGEGLAEATTLRAQAGERLAWRRVERLSAHDRPSHLVDPSQHAERSLRPGVFGRPLSRLGGAQGVFVNRDRLATGGVSSPLHWHSANEEWVFVLSGAPTLRQCRGAWPSGGGPPSFDFAELQESQLQPWRCRPLGGGRRAGAPAHQPGGGGRRADRGGHGRPARHLRLPRAGRCLGGAAGGGGVRMVGTSYWG